MNRAAQPQAEQLRVMAICLDNESQVVLQGVLSLFSEAVFIGNFSHYFGQKSDLSLAQRLGDWAPDVCIVDFDQDREQAAKTAEQLHHLLQGLSSIFAVSSRTEPELIITAMRVGCTEYLDKPVSTDKLHEALTTIMGRKREKQRTQKKGTVSTILGAKGGSGVTALATHLATFIPRLTSLKTLLIDQHTDLGDVAVYLGLDKHLYHFFELVNNVHRLDSELLAGFVLRHESGLEVLASPDLLNGNVATTVTEETLEQTIEFLRTVYDVIIIDCAPGLTGLNVAAVQQSDEIWLVATPEVPAIRNLSRYLEHLARFSTSQERINVVINRYSRKGLITQEQIEKTLQKRISLMVPNSYAEVIHAINTGKPVGPDRGSEFTRVVRQWADSYSKVSPASALKEEPRKRFGILGF